MFQHKLLSILFLVCLVLMSAAPSNPIQPSSEKPTRENTPLTTFKAMRDTLQEKSSKATLSKGEQKTLHFLDKKVTKWEKKNKYRAAKGKAPKAGKSWTAAFLLCLFVGLLGIHRFYLGYTWQGVVQLLTAGGFGIWWLVDFIRIIIKDLKPKDGDYAE